MPSYKNCITCGRLFEVCPQCEERRESYMRAYGQEPWRTVACSVECYQLYDIIRRFGYGQMSIEEAHALVSGIQDLPDLSAAPGSKAILEKILAYKPHVKTKKVVDANLKDKGQVK